MTATRFTVDGVTLTIDDDEEIENVVPLTRTPPVVGRGKGRSRLHAVCPLHGPSLSGSPCNKFSDLPGKGRGVKQPNPFLFTIVILRVLIKPVVIIGILYGGFTFGQHQIGNGLFSSIIPSTGVINTTGNGNGSVGQTGNNPDNGIRSDCFQSGNPCGLVLPAAPVVAP